MCLKELCEYQNQSPVTSCAILDGAAIVAMLKPEAAKKIADYAAQIFVPYIFS